MIRCNKFPPFFCPSVQSFVDKDERILGAMIGTVLDFAKTVFLRSLVDWPLLGKFQFRICNL
jgi:hypothetical protein